MARKDTGREAVAEPLTRPAAITSYGHTAHDWAARTRNTALDALRYTRFVTVMKGALPAAAEILVLAIIYYLIPHHKEGVSLTYERLGSIRNDLAMTKPRLTGTDDDGNPFTVTASAAIQDPKHPHRAELQNVQADMQFNGTNWMNASAGNGFFDMDAGTLKLTGGISLFTDSGYELHTDSADVDIKKNVFSGDHKVTGQGPLGSLSADSFHIDRLNKRMNLDGHVRMKMYPKKVKR